MKFGSREYFRYLEELQSRSPSSKADNPRRSSVEIAGALGFIRVTFDSRLSPQLRRAIIRGFFRHNKSWLRYFRSIAFNHMEHVNIDPHHAAKRGLPLFKSKNFDHPAGRVGFEIRLRRLNLGLTQAQLARRTGIVASHISLIERGLVDVRETTYKRLWDATQADILLKE
jgi:hypothetical protein